MERRDIKFELGADLENVDLNDLIHGITSSQQEVMMTNSMSVDLHDFHSGTSQTLVYNETSGVYAPQVPTVERPMPPPASSLNSYPGPHSFFVQFSEAQDSTKSTPWIFSEKLNKLYAGLNTPVPIHFLLANVYQPADYQNFQVRMQVCYSQAQDLHGVVQWCSLHREQPSASSDSNSLQNFCGKHFMVTDDPAAKYVQHDNGHLSLVVRLSPPAVGEAHVTCFLRFMCRSSCMGGINRRPITIVFTLETLQGDVLGRSCVPLRVCSCPGRDIKTDEERGERKRPSQTKLSTQEENQYVSLEMPQSKKKRLNNPAGTTETLDIAIAPALLTANDDDEVYRLEVRGRLKYEYLRSILASMEFMEKKKQN